MKFIGIDLGWTSGFSGLCCLNWDHNQLTLLDLTRFQPIEKVLIELQTPLRGNMKDTRPKAWVKTLMRLRRLIEKEYFKVKNK
jgi:hypothetical protein